MQHFFKLLMFLRSRNGPDSRGTVMKEVQKIGSEIDHSHSKHGTIGSRNMEDRRINACFHAFGFRKSVTLVGF